ncbi:MAG: DUF6288 domain-containing protein, partial [Verrucomicrobiota bacterium]
MNRTAPLIALVCLMFLIPVRAQVVYNGESPWSERTDVAPDDVVPGWFYNLGITGLRVKLDPDQPRILVVKYVFPDTPAAGHVQVDDLISGVEGLPFAEDHQNGYGPEVFGAQGPIGEFGIALDRVQGEDGELELSLIRGGTRLEVTFDVGQRYRSFSPTYPVDCPKSDLILEELLDYLRQTQLPDGSWLGSVHENHIFAGLALLSDGSPPSLEAASRLALSYRDRTVGEIPASGLSNWRYLAAAIYLAEYYAKTDEAWVLPKLRSLYRYLSASQYTDVSQIVPPVREGLDPTATGFGGWGHNPGFEGYGPISMTTGQGALALALMHRVGVTIDRSRLDDAYAFLERGKSSNNYVWYADQDGSDIYAWADPGRTGAAAIANWVSPYRESAALSRASAYADFIGQHPESFPDTHGSPTMGMAYTALGVYPLTHNFRLLMDANRWWFSLGQCPEGNFYYQPNRDNAKYSTNPRFVASSVVALILSLTKGNLLLTERVAEMRPVPDIVGTEVAMANNLIASRGFGVGQVRVDFSETVPAHSIISQHPENGTSRAAGSGIDYVVSIGMGGGPGEISVSQLSEEEDIVNTDGALVSAANFGESAVTVNGLPHEAGSASGVGFTSQFGFEGDFRNDGSESTMDKLLSGIAGGSRVEMSLGGLTINQEYLFQTYWEGNPGESLTIRFENGVPVSRSSVGDRE